MNFPHEFITPFHKVDFFHHYYFTGIQVFMFFMEVNLLLNSLILLHLIFPNNPFRIKRLGTHNKGEPRKFTELVLHFFYQVRVSQQDLMGEKRRLLNSLYEI